MKVRGWLWLVLAFALVAWAANAIGRQHNKTSPAARITDEVTLYGKVDDERATQVVSDIQEANRLTSNSPIRLYINSLGGSVLAGNPHRAGH